MLAFALLEKGCALQIVHNAALPSSSRVAAGLYNPVVFKRLLPSWRAAEVVPFLVKKYSALEALLQEKFLFSVNISKVIENQHELETWEKRAHSEDIREFILPKLTQQNPEGFKPASVLGFGEVVQSGYVDTTAFLNAAHAYFNTLAILQNHTFDYHDLELCASGLVYQNEHYDELVFCEGFFVAQNPYFSFLPFKPVKGEVLTVRIPGFQSKNILNKNFFLLPLPDGTFRLGATYDWKNLDFQPSAEAKDLLLARLSEYLAGDIEVLKHSAGVRPSSEDRRPILGPHPLHPQLHVFNGLGTKGVMLAPFFAEQLANYLVEGKALESEVSAARFYDLQKGV